MSQHLSDSDYNDTRAKKVEYISYFLSNHGNDCCFYEKLNSLYRPASAADIRHCYLVKGMWMMMNEIIT